MSLGYHLRSEQYISLASAEFSEKLLVGVLRARGVGVHSQYIRSRQKLGKLLLDALSAVSHTRDMLALTGRAGGRHGHSSSAPMTAKLAAIVRAAVGVIGHRNAAGRAGNSLTTASAGEEIVVSSAVDKED